MRGHRTGLIAIAIALALVTVSAVRAQEGADEARFWQALGQRDDVATAAALKTVLHARLASLKGPDATLDAMVGAVGAESGPLAAPWATVYLERAAATLPEPRRSAVRLIEARLREAQGDRTRAEALYTALARSADPDVKRQASYGLARVTLARTPEAVIALLNPVLAATPEAGARWEGHLLLSRALRLAGRGPEAQAALEAAWAEAPAAPTDRVAIARTAGDLSLGGDRAAQIKLRAVAGNQARFAGLARLPLCGDGLTPTDEVIVEIAGDGHGGVTHLPVSASRPDIAERFVGPLVAGLQPLGSGASLVALRCLSAPVIERNAAARLTQPIPEWLAQKGFYDMAFAQQDAGDRAAAIEEELQWREQHLGADSPQLIPILINKVPVLMGQAQAEQNSGYIGRIGEVGGQLIHLMTKANAPEPVLAMTREINTGFTPGAAKPSEMGPRLRRQLALSLAQEGIDPASRLDQSAAGFGQLLGSGLLEVDKNALVDQLLTFAAIRRLPPTNPVYQAVALTKVELLRQADKRAGIAPLVRTARLAPDQCDAAEIAPTHAASPPFTPDDYPRDLSRAGMTGFVIVESAVTAEGRPASQRLVVASPPRLFDDVTLRKAREMTYIPAENKARPVACRGRFDPVNWQLPG